MLPKSGEARCSVAKRQGGKVREEGEFVENYAVVLPHHLCEDLVVLVPDNAALVDLLGDRILLSRDIGVDHLPDQVKVDGLAGLEVQVDASDLETFACNVGAIAGHPVGVVFWSGTNELGNVGVCTVALQLVRHVPKETAQRHFVLVAGPRHIDY